MNLLDLNDDILRIIFSPQEIGQLGCTALRYVCKKSAEYVAGIHLSPQCAYRNAAIYGYTQLYDWIREASGQICKDVMILVDAICYGHLEFIQRIYSECSDLYIFVCEDAAASGHLHIIEWLESIGHSILYHQPIENAAENGHLHVLNWAISRNYIPDPEIADAAGRGGHICVLDWVISKNCEINPHKVASEAVRYGHTGVLEWLKSKGYSYIIEEDAIYVAAQDDHLPMLKYLHDDGVVFPENTGNYAARGSFELIYWIISIGFTPGPMWIPNAIITDDSVDKLEGLLSLYCKLSPDAYRAAIYSGSFDALNWLYAKGCPWDDSNIMMICDRGERRPGVLDWIHTHINGAINRFASTAGPREIALLRKYIQ